MAEKQQDLGKTPENHQEGQPHVCPACEREFKEIQDYPKVFVALVSVVTPDDVPAEIPHWWKEDLLAAPKDGWKRELVPGEVLEYFHANPDEDKVAYPDGYIYYRPYNQTQEYRRQRETHPEMYDRPGVVSVGGDRYKRQFNYAPIVKAVLEQNEPLREYLSSLKQMTGQEVPIKELFPRWQQHYFPSVFHVPSGPGGPNADRLLLRLSESKERATEYRVTEVGIWGNGPNMGSAGGPTIKRILPIAVLNYEGRVNQA